jgi:hypothetical protein
MRQPLWKTIWHLLKNLNTELSFDLKIPFLGEYSREMKTDGHKETCT